jgi:phospho-N-acetylmuramoyl-pentapeptide-transferase
MRSVVAAAALSLFLALLGTPLYIKFLVKRGYGQFIRDDGPTTHKTKRGTPTMGGVVIIGATIVGYFGSHLLTMTKPDGTVSLGLTPSSLLVLGLMTGLGFVGFARRLHQDQQAAQPRPALGAEAVRPAPRRHRLRRPGPAP